MKVVYCLVTLILSSATLTACMTESLHETSKQSSQLSQSSQSLQSSHQSLYSTSNSTANLQTRANSTSVSTSNSTSQNHQPQKLPEHAQFFGKTIGKVTIDELVTIAKAQGMTIRYLDEKEGMIVLENADRGYRQRVHGESTRGKSTYTKSAYPQARVVILSYDDKRIVQAVHVKFSPLNKQQFAAERAKLEKLYGKPQIDEIYHDEKSLLSRPSPAVGWKFSDGAVGGLHSDSMEFTTSKWEIISDIKNIKDEAFKRNLNDPSINKAHYSIANMPSFLNEPIGVTSLPVLSKIIRKEKAFLFPLKGYDHTTLIYNAKNLFPGADSAFLMTDQNDVVQLVHFTSENKFSDKTFNSMVALLKAKYGEPTRHEIGDTHNKNDNNEMNDGSDNHPEAYIWLFFEHEGLVKFTRTEYTILGRGGMDSLHREADGNNKNLNAMLKSLV